MHFLELLEEVSDRATAVYYAKHCGGSPSNNNLSAATVLMDGRMSFTWADPPIQRRK